MKSQHVIKNSITSFLLLAILFVVPSSFAAHFHYFVDIETDFLLNKNKGISALKISWLYDDRISELMKKGNSNLQALEQATMNDLMKQHYFINVQLNGKNVTFGRATHYKLHQVTVEGQKALQLDFELPLKKVIDMKGKNRLTWNFSDPSGTGVLTYYSQKEARLGKELQDYCKKTFKKNDDEKHNAPAQLLGLQCSI